MKRRMFAVVAATVILATGLIGAPSAAQAAVTCSGTRVDTVAVKNGAGTTVARVGVYRSGQTYCAVAVKAGSYYGPSSWMALVIHKTVDGNTVHKTDSGEFRYQTDALSIYAGNADYRRICFDVQVEALNSTRQFLASKCYYLPLSV